MPRDTQLNKNWNALMSLCTAEREYQRAGQHPKVLRLVSYQINALARDLGFSPRQIHTREFRAEKSGAHVIRLLTE